MIVSKTQLRALWKLRTSKWRSQNPDRARQLNKKHQYTWRENNLELNRLRARLGMAKLKQWRLSK